MGYIYKSGKQYGMGTYVIDSTGQPISVDNILSALSAISSRVTAIEERAHAMAKPTSAYTFDANNTSRTLSLTVTTHGRPVLIVCTGDINPTTAGAYATLTFARDSTDLSYQIVQSTGASVNNPFSMAYLDDVEAGTYTYKVTFLRGNGDFSMTESKASQSPNFIVVEI